MISAWFGLAVPMSRCLLAIAIWKIGIRVAMVDVRFGEWMALLTVRTPMGFQQWISIWSQARRAGWTFLLLLFVCRHSIRIIVIIQHQTCLNAVSQAQLQLSPIHPCVTSTRHYSWIILLSDC